VEVLRVPDDDLDFGPDQVMHYHGVPFTGISFEDDKGGRAELQYRNGLQDGMAREWWPSGQLKEETPYREGFAHGVIRAYDDAGRLIQESLREYGILLRRTTYDEDGAVETEDIQLDPNSYHYKSLQMYRSRLGWSLPE
jgi:hypothetical protein